MKLKLILVAFCYLLLNSVHSQNLVTNGSFEQFDSCPDNEAQIIRATGWSPTVGDAELYHVCAIWPICSVPPNNGTVLPATGDGMAGLIIYYSPIGSQEMIHTQLSNPLTTGVKYYISFKIRSRIDQLGELNMVVDKIGAKLSTGANALIDNSAQLYTSTIVTDSTNWTTVAGSFVADSAYTTLFVGIFFEKANINSSIVVPALTNRAYYYLDDVCLSTDSLECDGFVSINEIDKNNVVQMYPNPTSGIATIEAEAKQPLDLQVYNVSGQLLFTEQISAGQHEVDLNQYDSGVYFYTLSDEQSLVKRGKIVVVKNQ